MKKMILFLSAILLLLALTACETTNPTAATVPGTTVPTAAPVTMPSDPEPALRQQIADLLAAEGTYYNTALTSLYAFPKDIDLRAFFSHGFPDETGELTEAEWAQLENMGFDRGAAILRLPVSKMNGVLTGYFGITLSDTNYVGMEDMVYLESTDCYYLDATAAVSAKNVKILSMEAVRTGYCIAYEADTPAGKQGSPCLLVLRRSGSSFQIASNTQPDMELGVIPEIPIVTQATPLPAEPRLEDLVFTNYEVRLQWDSDTYYNAQRLSARLPAINPISNDAVAINEEIRQAFRNALLDARMMYYGSSPGSFQEIDCQIDYEAWLSGNALSILIRQTFDDILQRYYVCSLDISTGQRLTTADLARQHLGESYAQFVYRSVHDLNLYQLEQTGSGISFSNIGSDFQRPREYYMRGLELYMADGTLMVIGSIGTPSIHFDLPFRQIDIHNWSRTTEDIYHELWGKYLDSNRIFSYDDFLRDLFYAEPDVFVKMLALEDESTVKANISRLMPDVWDSEEARAQFIAACQTLADSFTDPAAAQTAQLLLAEAKRSSHSTTRTPPITTVKLPVTAPIEPTAPPKEFQVEGSLPEIPIVRKLTQCPEDPKAEQLVFANYRHSVTWTDKSGERKTVNVTLPAFLPICEEAVAINEEIRQRYEENLDSVRDSYTKGVITVPCDTDYTASLFGSILSVRILTAYHGNVGDYYDESIYMLDITTGQRVDTDDLITQGLGISYAEFLYHATGTIYENYYAYAVASGDMEYYEASVLDHLAQIETDVMAMQSYTLYTDENGTLFLPAEHFATGEELQLVYDPDAQCSGTVKTEADAYRWLFHLLEDGDSYPWACVMTDVFFAEPERFVAQLAAQEDADREQVTTLLMSAIGMDSYKEFKAICTDLLSSAGDTAITATLEQLLEALDKNPNYVT